MAEFNRDFKGVWIPKEVWLDTRLNMLEKGILTEIDSLDMGDRGCYASNKHIANFCQCSETKVSTAISKLIECGYLEVKSFDGRTRILKSRLSNFERQTYRNSKADLQSLKESNTYSKPVSKTDRKDIVEQVVFYLNEKAGTSYKTTNKQTIEHINARLDDGFVLEDFKTVIDRKVKDWSKDPKMCKYIRPQTLFNTKFEAYLNERGVSGGQTTGNSKQTKLYGNYV